VVALCEHRLRRAEGEIEREAVAGDMRDEAAVGQATQPPVVDRHVGVAARGLREAQPLACDPLAVQQMADCRIGERGVREQDLARRERARVIRADPRGGAEEGDLEAAMRAPRSVDPPGDVPPFGTVIGMRAMIAREDEGDTGPGHRKGAGGCRAEQREHRQQGDDPPHHQSSRTARTASTDTALRPASIAVSADAATSATTTPASSG